MLTKFRLEIILAIMVLLTIIAIVGEKQLVVSALTISPANNGIFDTFYTIDDVSSGGNSSAELIDPHKFDWHCTLRDKFAYRSCGLEIMFNQNITKGIDLRRFTKLRLHLNYKGPSVTLRLFLRNFDTQYSNTKDASSTKYNQVEFFTKDLKNNVIEVQISDFFVANWWSSQYKIPPELNRPQFDNIAFLDIQTGDFEALGEHQFQLQKIEFIGPRVSTEKWYLSIMLVWIFSAIIFLGFRITILTNKLREQKQREQELIETNALLDLRSKQLDEKTKTDSLTGAFNREGIQESLLIGLFEWRCLKKPLSIIMMDIDHFKKINDQYGHLVGDYVLTTFSEIVKNNIRGNDLFARWGGEEFLLVCRNTNAEHATIVAEKIRILLSKYKFDHDIHLTSSFGVASFNDKETPEQLFKYTDEALYIAKNTGRNKVIVSVR